MYHQSSHLGDELLLRGESEIERENLSFESAELILSQEFGFLRLYAGGEYLFNRRPSTLDDWVAHAGAEARAGPTKGLRLVAAVDVKSTEQQEWEPAFSVRAGVEAAWWRLEGHPPRIWSILAEYYDGPRPTGSSSSSRSDTPAWASTCSCRRARRASGEATSCGRPGFPATPPFGNVSGMDVIRARIEADRFAAENGITLVEVRPGAAVARLEVGARHLNGVGIVQGGAIFTLADLAFAAAANSHGEIAVAIDVSISFIRAVSGGTLTADAREEAVNPRLSTCVVRVTDEAGALVALFKGTAYRKRGGGAAAG